MREIPRDSDLPFPQKGVQYAVLTKLFRVRNNGGGLVSRNDLKEAIAFERDAIDDPYEITDGALRTAIKILRKSFREYAPDFKIVNRHGRGYKIVENGEVD